MLVAFETTFVQSSWNHTTTKHLYSGVHPVLSTIYGPTNATIVIINVSHFGCIWNHICANLHPVLSTIPTNGRGLPTASKFTADSHFKFDLKLGEWFYKQCIKYLYFLVYYIFYNPLRSAIFISQPLNITAGGWLFLIDRNVSIFNEVHNWQGKQVSWFKILWGPGSWVQGPGSWILGPKSWVLGPGSWVWRPESPPTCLKGTDNSRESLWSCFGTAEDFKYLYKTNQFKIYNVGWSTERWS